MCYWDTASPNNRKGIQSVSALACITVYESTRWWTTVFDSYSTWDSFRLSDDSRRSNGRGKALQNP